jgi:hypothetical protein
VESDDDGNQDQIMEDVMRKLFRPFLFVALLFTLANSAWAQLDNVGDLLRGGIDDANLLLEAYLRPFGNGFGADVSNGWYTTAETHKLFGFDINISGNIAIAPEAHKSFDVAALALQNMRLSAGADSDSPTIVGDDEPGPQVDITSLNPSSGQTEVVGTYVLPQGVGFRAVPAPMVQASIGLVAGTNLIVRVLPEIKVSDDVGRFRLFGFGLKHNINQWLPAGRVLPFDVAVMAGFTRFQVEADLTVLPDEDAIPTGYAYDLQQVDMEARSMTFNLILSKNLRPLTLFAGFGYEKSTVDIRLAGTFPFTVLNSAGQKEIQDSIDPVDLSFDGSNGLRGKLGVKVTFLFLSAFASYTLADYPVVSAGLAFGMR